MVHSYGFLNCWVRVGLLVGAIGFFCNQIKTRWYASDLSDLEYIYAVIKD